ncbi:MAG: PepSY domain-containing protein, partial [Methylobacterium sp.]|nr:PepSY domain-containing protein [Methylobacterium sp.]
VYETLREQFPARNRSWRLEIPLAPDRPVMARYYKPAETAHRTFAPLMVAVDPYTLKLLNTRFWGDYLGTWIYDLHYTLLMDRTGKVLMFLTGLVFMITIAIGLGLWWPSAGRWRKASRVLPRTPSRKRIYDLHTTGGIYSAVLLLALAVSGSVLSKPEWIKPVISHLSSTREAPLLSSTPAGQARITVDRALEIASGTYPEAQPRWIETPDGDDGVFLIRLRSPAEPGNRFPKTQVWVDPYSGRVLHHWSGLERSGGQAFLDWMHPIHSGEAFGLTGRLIIFASGLVPMLLWITGWMRWRHKTRPQR